MRQSQLVLIPMLFMLAIGGCGEQHFRAETTWHPDGRVTRATYQPSEFFPQKSQTAWEAVEPAPEIAADAFSGQIRDQATPTESDPSYLVTWGTFLSPANVPASLRFPAPDPEKTGTLQRNAEVKHFGLVDEYVWNETLTDVVSLPDMELARREAAGLAVDLVEDTLRDGQPHYDLTGLLDWLRGDVAVWFAESHAALVEAVIQGDLRKDKNHAFPETLATIAERYGLLLKDENGRLLEDPEFSLAIDQFLVTRLREKVRATDGTPIDETAARQLLAKIGLTKDESLKFEPSPSLQEAIIAHFGSEEAANAKGAELATRLFGVYQQGFFLPRRPFHYEMTVPGSIVESSGEIVAENHAIWRFDAMEAFPFGYSMTVRSLAPNEAGQQAVFGEVRLTSREELTTYATLVRADATLATVIAKCIQEGSLHPFDDHEKALADSKETEPADVARATAFRRLIDKHAQAK